MDDLLSALKAIGPLGFLDILLMAILLYGAMVWLKQKQAFLVLTGILICGLVYLLAHQFNMALIAAMLRAFFAVILIAVIVIFRDELRQAFERVARWSLERRLKRRPSVAVPRAEVEMLVRLLVDLARAKIGALVVVRGRDVLTGVLDGGTHLDGVLSESLLHSLFDPGSPGHDGAVVIEHDRVQLFGAHLPLSTAFEKLGQRGTRHAAALGLAEQTDALCLVVSEERGEVSIARDGTLTKTGAPEEIRQALEAHYERTVPRPRKRTVRDLFARNYREKLLALAMAIALWFVLVYESRIVHESFSIPVEHPGLDSGLVLSELRPGQVQVTFSGPRNAFHLINAKSIRLSVPLLGVGEGFATIRLSEANVKYPKEITLEQIVPRRVRIRVQRRR